MISKDQLLIECFRWHTEILRNNYFLVLNKTRIISEQLESFPSSPLALIHSCPKYIMAIRFNNAKNIVKNVHDIIDLFINLLIYLDVLLTMTLHLLINLYIAWFK